MLTLGLQPFVLFRDHIEQLMQLCTKTTVTFLAREMRIDGTYLAVLSQAIVELHSSAFGQNRPIAIRCTIYQRQTWALSTRRIGQQGANRKQSCERSHSFCQHSWIIETTREGIDAPSPGKRSAKASLSVEGGSLPITAFRCSLTFEKLFELLVAHVLALH